MPKIKIVKTTKLSDHYYGAVCLLDESDFIDISSKDLEVVKSAQFLNELTRGGQLYTILLKKDELDPKMSSQLVEKFNSTFKCVKNKIEKAKDAEQKRKEQLAIKKKLAEHRKIEKARKLLIEKGIISGDNSDPQS